MLFRDIIGQDIIKNRLIDSVKKSRISHAQLFLGPDGSGKLALAITYAQYINCENKKDDDSCGVCNSCNKYNKLLNPDLHLFFPNATTKNITKNPNSQLFLKEFRELLIEKNYYISLGDWYEKLGNENKQGYINKDDCNEMVKILSLKSFESEYKIIIIWMVEKIYPTAAPKILKILEEPPEKTLFLLISEDHENIISTIKSRAQLIKIPKLGNKEIEKALIDKKNCEPEEARKIATLSDGNYIEALQLLDNKDEDDYYFKKFQQWMRLCYKINITELNKFIDEIASIGRERQKQFFTYSLKIIRESLNYNFKNNYLLKFDSEVLIFVKNFSTQINEANIYEIVEEFNKALYHIERNANPKILFMDLSFTFNKLLKLKVNA